jgi:hypothetical protein
VSATCRGKSSGTAERLRDCTPCRRDHSRYPSTSSSTAERVSLDHDVAGAESREVHQLSSSVEDGHRRHHRLPRSSASAFSTAASILRCSAIFRSSSSRCRPRPHDTIAR